MLISIIIPIYNVSLYIEGCLMSVLNQTYRDIEVILIDDKSPDDSIEIVKNTLERESSEFKVSILSHDVNKGLSEARNTGIKAATGEYIFFLDSDDKLTMNCIETLVNHSSDADMVLGGVISSNNKLYTSPIGLLCENKRIQNTYFYDKIYEMAWNKLLKRSFILSNHLFFKPRLVHEDFLWTYQVCMLCSKVQSISDITYIYNVRSQSLNLNFTIRNINHYLTGLSCIWDDLNQRDVDVNPKVAYTINKVYIIKKRAIRDARLPYTDFKGLDFSIYMSYIKSSWIHVRKLSTLLKFFILILPLRLQFLLLKTLFAR